MSVGDGAHPDLDKGFTEVDAQPDPSMLVAAMEATATWPAVVQLRAWERVRLGLRPGADVLDVGCGIGDVLRELASEIAPGGRAIGIDASEAMLDVARQRAEREGVDAVFRTGDALSLPQPDGSVDVCRSERMLQWLADPAAAVAEMVRVLRPGGRLSLIDTDWRTFAVDLPDDELNRQLQSALVAWRGAPAGAGGRLLNFCRANGLVDLDHAGAVHVWSEWNPDESPSPGGLFPLATVMSDLAALGYLGPGTARRIVDECEAAGREGRLWISLTMFAVSARRP